MENIKNYTEYKCKLMSDNILDIVQALAKAKPKFKHTGKKGFNSHQKLSYALLPDIYDAVRDALLEQNIVIWHGGDLLENGTEILVSRLIHTMTGQWLQDIRPLISEKPGNQARASANTYMRKTAILSLCGIGTEEDDDSAEEEKYIEKEANNPITKEQFEVLSKEIKSCDNRKDMWDKIKGFNRINTLEELNQASFNSVLSYIKKNAQRNISGSNSNETSG